jgi:hypothetical protein
VHALDVKPHRLAATDCKELENQTHRSHSSTAQRIREAPTAQSTSPPWRDPVGRSALSRPGQGASTHRESCARYRQELWIGMIRRRSPRVVRRAFRVPFPSSRRR